VPDSQIDRVAVVAVLIAFLGLLAAYVVLTMTDHDGEGVTQLAITVATVLGLGAYTRGHLTRQDGRLQQIESQTNGVLDARIRAQTTAAMRELMAETGTVPVPVTVIPHAAVSPPTPGQLDAIHDH
jgi:hypothetical protein